MSQKSVINAAVFFAALLFTAIVIQSIRPREQRDDRRSSASAPDYRPQLSLDVFARALEQSSVPAQNKKSNAAPRRTPSEPNTEESRQLTASR